MDRATNVSAKDLFTSINALEHVATNGWGNGGLKDKIQSSGGDFTKQDPQAVEKLASFKEEILESSLTATMNTTRKRSATRLGDIALDSVLDTLVSLEPVDRDKYELRLDRLANRVDDWLQDRDIEVNGCDPKTDCHGQIIPGRSYRTCGHLRVSGCRWPDRR